MSTVLQAQKALEQAERQAGQPGLSADVQRARDRVVEDLRRKLSLAEDRSRRELSGSARRR